MTLNAKEYKPGLGKREASLITGLAEQNKTIFTVDDAKNLAGPQAKEIIRWLVKKKWVLPLKRGLYAIVPLDVGLKGADAFVIHNFIIASLLVEPYYIGYWSALNYHGLTDQIPRTTFIVTTRARHPLSVLDAEYYFVKLTHGKFFGWETVKVEDHDVYISNPEKTVVDCLDHPEHCGGIEQIARAIYFSHEEINLDHVVEYANRMNNQTILKRLGFILEVTGLQKEHEGLFKEFRLSSGFPKLDTLSPRMGRHNSRWGLFINFKLNPEGWIY